MTQGNPYGKGIDAAISTLASVKAAAVAAGQEKVFAAATSPESLDAPQATIKSAVSSLLKGGAKAAGAAGGAALCASIGAPMLAPACGAAGAWAAEKAAAVVESIGKAAKDFLSAKGGAGAGDIEYWTWTPDDSIAKDKRQSVLAALALTGDDPIAVDAIRDLADEVAPTEESKVKPRDRRAVDIPVWYATFGAVPPWVLSPSTYKAEPQNNVGNVFGLGWKDGGPKWRDRTVDGLMAGMGAIPIGWAKPVILEKGKAFTDITQHRELIAVASEVLVPEIDKWVASRIKWILEQSAMRRNLQATAALQDITSELRAARPDWKKKEVDAARSAIQSAVESGNPALAKATAQKLLAVKDPSSVDVGAIDTNQASSQQDPYGKGSDGGEQTPYGKGHKPKGKGGTAVAAVALALAIAYAMKGR